MFLWKVCKNILPTMERLYNWKIVDDTLCPICAREHETVEHIIWNCESAKDVWLEGPLKLQKSTSDNDSFLNIFAKMESKPEEEELQLFVTIAHNIWLQRNTTVYGGSFDAPNEAGPTSEGADDGLCPCRTGIRWGSFTETHKSCASCPMVEAPGRCF